ncbi:hypothetical protein KC345_g9000 [Hortaea werneckii]|nr:hypothetical protein KC345_g9000 [Hortaea werneckii]
MFGLLRQLFQHTVQAQLKLSCQLNYTLITPHSLGVYGIDAAQNMAGAQHRQHRLQRIINREQMREASAHEERQDNFAGQPFLRNQIEEGLQNSRIGSFVHRTHYDHRIRFRHQTIRFDDSIALKLSVNQILRRKLRYINTLHFEPALPQIPLGIFDHRINP